MTVRGQYTKYGPIGFLQKNPDVPKAHKMASGGLGGAVSLQWESGDKAPQKF